MVSLSFSSIKPADIRYQLAHYNDNDGPIITWVTSVAFVIALFLVILRFITRYVKRIKCRIEDYLIVVALVLALGLWVEALLAVEHGAGQHSLRVFQQLGLNSILSSLKILFALEVNYNISHLAIKMSILFLYRTIFTFVIDSFRRAWYAVFIYVLVNALVSEIMVLVQCRPLSYSWEEPTGAHGSCINLKANQLSNGATTAFADLLLLVLPMPVFRALHIPRKQKIALYGLFALGFLALAANIVRLYYLGIVESSVDFTYIEVNPFIWSVVEVDLGIICACIPTIKPLFVRNKENSQLSNQNHSSDACSSRGWKGPKQSLANRPEESVDELVEFEMEPRADESRMHSQTDVQISRAHRAYL